MEICLQAALRLKSVASFSGLASVAYLNSCLFFCLLYNIISQTVLPLLQTQSYLENTLINFHYPSTLHIFLSTYSFM